MDPAAIHDHHDVFAGGAEGGHDLMEILAELLGIKVRHDLIEPMVLVSDKPIRTIVLTSLIGVVMHFLHTG